MIPAHTQRLLDFLSDAASYPHRPAQVTLRQTHASWVFIASPFVYKVKKPVNFGFLDFSTLELRRADCEHEIALNRRLTDDLYLGVEAVVEQGGSLHIGGEGVAIEWAVKMREMDAHHFMKQLLQEQQIGTHEIDRIVNRLHRFYSTQLRLPKREGEAAAGRMKQWTEDNFASARNFVGETVSAPALEAISLYTREFLSRRRAIFAARAESGRILDCHGDLHLDHIHLTDQALQIFDCIEFNEGFRHIDVANDIAFLAMDLDFNDRPDLSRHLVRSFASMLEDYGMLRLMDFYKCYRACVRGKVESMHAQAETAPEDERIRSFQLARRYFQHALHYAIAGSVPQVFVFMGKVASGKSALAAALANETGWRMLSSDIVRKTLAGTPPNYRGSLEERAALYSESMTQRTYHELFDQAFAELHRGHCIILDATFSKLAHRNALQTFLTAEGYQATWIEAIASEPTIRDRLMQRDDDPASVSDARFEDYQHLSASYEPPLELLPDERFSIATDGRVDRIFATLLEMLAARRVP